MEAIALGGVPYAVALMRAIAVVQAGGVIISPTDTVYGLVCNGFNESAVRKMFAIKHRPQEKAFPIFVRDIAMARRYAYISDVKARMLEKIWPGAVTAVFHHKEKLPPVLTGGRNTIGIRILDHPFLAALLAKLDMPLAQTSANIAELPPARTAAEAAAYFEKNPDQPDLIIDGGEISSISSTVIDCTGASPLILRSGIVSKADIDRLLGNA
ncbi:MAG: L-threonylcarbamoyladenylate synthase [Candidatus Sungiibacteriota bacterium]